MSHGDLARRVCSNMCRKGCKCCLKASFDTWWHLRLASLHDIHTTAHTWSRGWRCRGRGKDIAAEQAARSAAGLEVEARRGGGQGQGVRAGKVLQFQGRTRAAGLEHDPGRGPDLGIAGGEGGTIQRRAEQEGGNCPQLAQEVLRVELFPLSSPEDLQHRLAGSWGVVTKGTR